MYAQRPSSVTALIAAAIAIATIPAAASAEDFLITIENLSPNVLTPAPFISHDASFDLFSAGAMASPEVELLAEDGMPGGVIDLANAAGRAVADHGIAFGPGGGPIPPGASGRTKITADAARPMLSFLSMLAFSNDAFIGVAIGDGAIDLFPGGVPLRASFLVTPREVWDAGTEINDELAAHVPALGAPVGAGVDEHGVISRPHAGILGVGDIPRDRNWLNSSVARITIVPEPATLSLLALGLIALAARRRG